MQELRHDIKVQDLSSNGNVDMNIKEILKGYEDHCRKHDDFFVELGKHILTAFIYYVREEVIKGKSLNDSIGAFDLRNLRVVLDNLDKDSKAYKHLLVISDMSVNLVLQTGISVNNYIFKKD